MDSQYIDNTEMLATDSLLAEQDATNTATRAFLTQSFPTLGAQLVREARYHMSRKLPDFPWLRPLEITMERLATLPMPSQDRFQRIDAMPPDESFSASALTNTSAYTPTAFNNRRRDDSNRQPFASPRQDSLPHFVGHTTEPARLRPSNTDQRAFTPVPTSSMANLDAFMPARAGSINRSDSLVRESSLKSAQQEATEPVRPVRTDTGSALAPHIQQRVNKFVGEDAKHIRIHDDPASQAFAQAQKADAVTLGQHVFFARDRFHPEDEEGFALLTHEALHVVQAMRPGSSWRRATQAGTQEEERQAATIEHQALAARHNASWESQIPIGQARAPFARREASLVPGHQGEGSVMQLHQGEVGAVEVAATSVGSAPRERPMRAASDRTLENEAPAPVAPDMRELKRAVYRDLMRQIKTDQERGG